MLHNHASQTSGIFVYFCNTVPTCIWYHRREVYGDSEWWETKNMEQVECNVNDVTLCCSTKPLQSLYMRLFWCLYYTVAFHNVDVLPLREGFSKCFTSVLDRLEMHGTTHARTHTHRQTEQLSHSYGEGWGHFLSVTCPMRPWIHGDRKEITLLSQ